MDFAYAGGSPLNENDQYTIKSTARHATGIGFVGLLAGRSDQTVPGLQ